MSSPTWETIMSNASQLRSIQEIRFARYQEAITEFSKRWSEKRLPEHGRLSRFARYTDNDPRYLSHINNGRKSIGDETARKIERRMKKPAFWMDTPPDSPERGMELPMLSLLIRACSADAIATHKALSQIVDAAH
jgi:hypothetical protein